MTTLASAPPRPRRAVQAMKRGVLGRCPACGEGHIFRAYLKVQDHCERCGEELHHHRADDAPPYVTILIVAHVVGFLILTATSFDEQLPMGLQVLLWPGIVVALSLSLLPRIKGALIALQWALRMHGFGEEGAE